MARDPNYSHLPLIAFETPEDREEVRLRGAEKFKSGLVLPKALELGEKHRHLIESSYIPKVSVRWINDDVDFGLFAEEDIKKGSYVGEYTGIVRRNDRRYFEPLNHYCYEYPIEDEIGRPFVTDASQGCLTRFINHSDRPNLQPIHAFYDDFYHLIFLAIKPIKKGTQLSYDYGKNYWYTREPPKSLSK